MFQDRSKETDKGPLQDFCTSEQNILSWMHNTQPSGLPYIIFSVTGHPISWYKTMIYAD
jgi:hypothetical protein